MMNRIVPNSELSHISGNTFEVNQCRNKRWTEKKNVGKFNFIHLNFIFKVTECWSKIQFWIDSNSPEDDRWHKNFRVRKRSGRFHYEVSIWPDSETLEQIRCTFIVHVESIYHIWFGIYRDSSEFYFYFKWHDDDKLLSFLPHLCRSLSSLPCCETRDQSAL